MFSLKEHFEFLDDGIDIPFYNDIPKLSVFDWGIILASLILMIGYITVIPITNEYLPLAIFLTGTIPALYICKGNYGLFFKKLRLKDIKLIILCVIGVYIYVVLIRLILSPVGMTAHAGLDSSVSLLTIVNLLLQVLGEEFFKVFILLIAMYLVYKITGNRNMSIFIGIIASMIIFGLAHYDAYDGKILQILLVQGFGSIFEYYAYLKTKNILVSYLIHLIQDLIPVVMILLHIMPV